MTLKASADIAALSLDDLAHAFALSQVGDRACKLQHPVIAACRELQLVHRRLHEIFAGFIQVAELADFGRAHIGVTGYPIRTDACRPYAKSIALTLTSGFDPLAHYSRRFTQAFL